MSYIILFTSCIIKLSYISLQQSHKLLVGTAIQDLSKFAVCQVLPQKLKGLLDCKVHVVVSGSYGECYLKTYSRYNLIVIEKRLAEGSLASFHREAYFTQLFSHRCVPLLVELQTQTQPFQLYGIFRS